MAHVGSLDTNRGETGGSASVFCMSGRRFFLFYFCHDHLWNITKAKQNELSGTLPQWMHTSNRGFKPHSVNNYRIRDCVTKFRKRFKHFRASQNGGFNRTVGYLRDRGLRDRVTIVSDNWDQIRFHFRRWSRM
jgi:hypothetical protein